MKRMTLFLAIFLILLVTIPTVLAIRNSLLRVKRFRCPRNYQCSIVVKDSHGNVLYNGDIESRDRVFVEMWGYRKIPTRHRPIPAQPI